MTSFAKTTGSRGIHVYVPIVRGPTQKQVWTFAKAIGAGRSPPTIRDLITAEYRIAKRPDGRVLVDYNQNAWGRTLASVYSVRPQPLRHRLHAGRHGREIERGIRDRGLSPRQHAGAGRARRAICGSRCWPPRGRFRLLEE